MKITLYRPATGMGLAAVPLLGLLQGLTGAGATRTGPPGYTTCVGASEPGS